MRNKLINESEKSKKIFTSDIKNILAHDAILAAKIIEVVGGEYSLRAYTSWIERDSKTLTKKTVLKVISNYLKIPIENLFEIEEPETTT